MREPRKGGFRGSRNRLRGACPPCPFKPRNQRLPSSPGTRDAAQDRTPTSCSELRELRNGSFGAAIASVPLPAGMVLSLGAARNVWTGPATGSNLSRGRCAGNATSTRVAPKGHQWTFAGHHSGTKARLKIVGWEEWDIDAEAKVVASRGWFDAEDYGRQMNAD